MLLCPGSTTTTKASTARTVPLARCSIPASISRITTSSLLRIRWLSRAFRSVLSGQMHPLPPEVTVPMISSLTPSFSSENLSGMSSTFGFNLKKGADVPGLAPVRSSIRSFISTIGVILCTSSKGIPRAAPKLASGLASIASTLYPLEA
ncbi:MAG: hypothetical protein DDT26_01616 [Dehalococcoidia bacterium]|nr:hypothetical protein [Chloroflexota bacterium]